MDWEGPKEIDKNKNKKKDESNTMTHGVKTPFSVTFLVQKPRFVLPSRSGKYGKITTQNNL